MKWLKRIFSFVVVLCMCFNLFSLPFTVHAEDPTYIEYTAYDCFNFAVKKSGESWPYAIISTSLNGRILFLHYGSNYYFYIIMPADNSSSYYMRSETYNTATPNSCITATSRTDNITIDNQKYFYFHNIYSSSVYDTFNAPVIELSTSGTANERLDLAVYYTYGAGSVDPSVDPVYGRPADVSYMSYLAGNGNASSQNIDRITWDSSRDTNGNDLPMGARVQIRAIPGRYTGNTKQNLLSQASIYSIRSFTVRTFISSGSNPFLHITSVDI